MTVTKEARAIEQARCEQENVAFHKWWEESGHAADPIFTLTMENCAHSAWQYRASISSRSAEAGKPVVGVLVWRKPLTSNSLSRTNSIIGAYRVWTHHEANGQWFWQLEDGEEHVVGSEAEGKAAAQADYEARILSALSMPADIEPVAWHRCKSFMHHFVLGAERPANNTSNPNEWTPLYAAQVADREPVSVPDIERLAQSLTDMITEWVECGIKGGTDWRNCLYRVILARIHRLAAAPQPDPSKVDADAVIERLTKAVEIASDQILSMYRTWIADDYTAIPPENSLPGRAYYACVAALAAEKT